MELLLVTNPVSFIETLSPFAIQFIIFCATTLGTITVVWVLLYLLVRPIPDHCIFAPFEKITRRFLNVAVVAGAALAAYAASAALKNYFQIGRPDVLNFNFHPLLVLNDFGFPSSHAAVFSAIATALFLIHRRAGVYATLLALTIGTARILAGVHTPLDILGGYLLGTACGTIAGFLVSKLVTAREEVSP